MIRQAGGWGLSEPLRTFIEEMPYERESILAFVREVSEFVPAAAVVLDIGAGRAPYRELFDHCEYVTADWQGSLHEQAGEVDVLARAEALPLEAESVDAALLTQVLEHVPDPLAVLHEVARVVRPRGHAFLTVPFVWELHELPNDFWRFTPESLERVLTAAGFTEVVVRPRTDCFTTVAQLLHNLRWAMGRAADGRDPERETAATLLDEAANRIAALAPLDVNWSLPLGWTVTARRT